MHQVYTVNRCTILSSFPPFRNNKVVWNKIKKSARGRWTITLVVEFSRDCERLSKKRRHNELDVEISDKIIVANTYKVAAVQLIRNQDRKYMDTGTALKIKTV